MYSLLCPPVPGTLTLCSCVSCSVCSRIGALQGLRTVFREYIRTAGSAVVKDEHKVS